MPYRVRLPSLSEARSKRLLVCMRNNYSFGGQTTIGSLSKLLLVRARSTTDLSANNYCSMLDISIASLLGLGKSMACALIWKHYPPTA